MPLEVDEVAAILDATPDRYRALVVLGAGCGLRLGEALGLTVDRVEFLKRTVRVDRQLLTIRQESVFGPPKTPTSVRTVPAPEVVTTALAAHIDEFGTGRDGVIFTNKNGAPVKDNAWHGLRRGITQRCGVEWTFHELRHFYASALIAYGASVKTVQRNLGHKNSKETLDTYGHLWPDSDDRTRATVDAVLGAVCHGRVTELDGDARNAVAATVSALTL